MFVRKKRNKSGSVSVQIIDKWNGYKVIQTIGSSKDISEVERFYIKAHQIIHSLPPGQQLLFTIQSQEEMAVKNFVESLSNTQIHTLCPELIFGTLYDRIGFNPYFAILRVGGDERGRDFFDENPKGSVPRACPWENV